MRRPGARLLLVALVVAAFGAVLASVLLPDACRDFVAARALTDLLRLRAPGETGAVNLVSAIYLGYRALDTLGETVALLLAVAGVALLLEDEG